MRNLKIKTCLTSCSLLFMSACLAETTTHEWQSLADDKPTQRLENLSQDWVVNYDGNYPICQGFYQPPSFNPLIHFEGPKLTGESGAFANDGPSNLSGNVLIEDQGSRLFADKVTLYRNKTKGEFEWAKAYGNVFYEQPDSRIFAGLGTYEINEKKVSLDEAQFRLYPAHARGTADHIAHISEQPYFLEQTSYTTCQPSNNFWHVTAKSLKLDTSTNLGQAYHSVLYIKDVPVFYTPYLAFPIANKRQSGFLMPLYSVTKQGGESLSIPYYFNLAPNYDSTLTSTYMRKRGLQLGGEFRYLTDSSSGQLNAEYTPNDNELTKFKHDKLPPNNNINPLDPRARALRNSSSSRKSFSWQDNTTFNRNLSTHLKYGYVSDDNYFEDFGNSQIVSNDRKMARLFQIQYNNQYLETQTSYQSYQMLQPFEASVVNEPFRLSPRFQATSHLPNLWGDIQPGIELELTHFVAQEKKTSGTTDSDGKRFFINPSLAYEYQLPYFYATPKVSLYSLYYDMNLNDADKLVGAHQSPAITVPVFNFDTGLFFERSGAWFNNAYLQTLEPRLFYTYVPFKNQNNLPLFDTGFSALTADNFTQINRFTGHDRIGDTNHLGASLKSRFLDDETAEEKASWELSQIFYYSDRKVGRCDTDANPSCLQDENPQYEDKRSDILGKSLYHFDNNWQAIAKGQWNHEDLNITSYDFTLQYNAPNHLVFDFGYLARKIAGQDKYHQYRSGFAWQITPSWNLLGYAYRDITEGVYVESFAGIEYESCCWAFRLGKRRYLKPSEDNITDSRPLFDSAIFFEFLLKGLSSYGDSHTSYIQKSLENYEDRFGKRY